MNIHGRYLCTQVDISKLGLEKIEINTLSNVGSCRHVKKYKLKQTWWKQKEKDKQGEY